MLKTLALCGALLLATTACSNSGNDSSDESGTSETTAPIELVTDPSPPQLPEDFTWVGRYVVPDLDVEVPFTWHGDGGNFQMIAGGEGLPIHFTNLIYDGELYTLTYTWPDVERRPCSHVGPFSLEDLNAGLADAAFVGRETLHDEQTREVHHFRSTAVVELPADAFPDLDGVTLRIPIMAGDIYVDVDDPTTFWKVLHFGMQNLYDPDLDEWIVIDEVEPVAGTVSLPEECAQARESGTDDTQA